MGQLAYGTITITDTNDIESIIVEYAKNQDPQNAPTTNWNTTRPPWAEGYYIWQRTRTHKTGTATSEDIIGTAVCITGSTGQTGGTGAAGRSLTSTTTQYTTATNLAIITENNMGDYTWNSNVPAYSSSTPAYWVRVTNVYSNPSSTTYVIYKDNGLTDAIAKSVEANNNSVQALSVATNVVEDAQGAIAIARAQEQHFWFNAADIGSGVNLIESGAYITDTAIDTFKSGKSGGYLLARSDKVEMGKASAKYVVLDATSLKFYTPGTTYKGIEVGTGGITIYRGWDATEQENLKGIEITPLGIDIYGGLSNANKKVASFGETVVLGQNENNNVRTEISGIDFSIIEKNYQGQDTKIFSLNMGDYIGNLFFLNPNLTFGDRNVIPPSVAYDDTSTYWVGKTCIYNNEEYVCKEQIDTPEAFDSSKWEKVVGYYSSAFGAYNVAAGTHSFAEGFDVTAIGDYSHAEGHSSIACGNYSHAEGDSHANGNYSHAEGYDTNANGDYSHAEGYNADANGNYSHAEGHSTYVTGDYSHAEGYSTLVAGNYSHAEGYDTNANGDYSHAEGYDTSASGTASHAEGYGTHASGNYSHAMGYGTIASSNYQTVMGQYNAMDSSASFIIGNGSSDSNRSNLFTITNAGDLKIKSNNIWIINGTDSKNYLKISSDVLEFFMNVDNVSTSVASFGVSARIGQIANNKSRVEIKDTGIDFYNRSSGTDVVLAHIGYGTGKTEGGSTSTSKYPYYTFGLRKSDNSSTRGIYSVAEGNNVTASGYTSHAEGDGTTASEACSHAEGSDTTASGPYSHAEGWVTTASKSAAHAEGDGTTASGYYSHAEGVNTTASGSNSHAQNNNTIAGYVSQTAIGEYNKNKSANAFEIGNGSSYARSNALEVTWAGDVKAAGALFADDAEFSKQTGNHIVVGGIHICWGDVSISCAAGTYTQITVTLPYTYTSAPHVFTSFASQNANARTTYGTNGGDLSLNKIHVGAVSITARNQTVCWMTIGA